MKQKKPGRPALKDQRKAAARMLARGVRLKAVCRKLGISKSAASLWQKEPAFLEILEDERARFEAQAGKNPAQTVRRLRGRALTVLSEILATGGSGAARVALELLTRTDSFALPPPALAEEPIFAEILDGPERGSILPLYEPKTEESK